MQSCGRTVATARTGRPSSHERSASRFVVIVLCDGADTPPQMLSALLRELRERNAVFLRGRIIRNAIRARIETGRRVARSRWNRDDLIAHGGIGRVVLRQNVCARD